MAVKHTLTSVCEVRGEKMLKRVGGSIGFSSNIINLEITSLKCAFRDYCCCKVNERKRFSRGGYLVDLTALQV